MLTDDEVKIRRSAAYSLRKIRDKKAANSFRESGVTVNSGTNDEGIWYFTIMPILGNTTYSFTIYDQFGNSKTAYTWLNYEEPTEEPTEESNGMIIITSTITLIIFSISTRYVKKRRS